VEFWYSRELVITRQFAASKLAVQALRDADMSKRAKSELRAPVLDSDGTGHKYSGSVAAVEDSFLFVKVDALPDNVYVHRSRVVDATWATLKRGSNVEITIGFNMRGPSAISLRSLD